MIRRILTYLFIGLFAVGLLGTAPTQAVAPAIQVVFGGVAYYPGDEILELRTENSKSFVMPNGNIGVDISMGAIHYKDDYTDDFEQWKDIDLTWEGNTISRAPYELIHNGNQIIVRDKKTGNISTIELLEIGGQHIPPQAWERSRGLAKAFGNEIEIVAENTRVSFSRIIPSSHASTVAKYRVTGNIPLQVGARDTEGVLSVEWTLEDGILTEELKPDRPIEYPVRIDPTLNIRVGALTDDAVIGYAASYFVHTDGRFRAGYEGPGATAIDLGSVARFLNITIPQGTTISTASLVLTGYYDRALNDVNTRLRAQDADDTVTFDDFADFDARSWTVAVYWDSIAAWSIDEESADTTSPEIKTCIQEVIDRPGWSSGNSIVILWDDFEERSTVAASTSRWAYSYNGSTSKAPLLHIEYIVPPTLTTGAASSVEETTATLNGEVTAIGDTSITDRGFVWDLASQGAPGDVAPGASGYANNWVESAGYGTGVFSHGLTSLTRGELYYVRACAQNDDNVWGYGDEVTFLTKPDPPYSFSATSSGDGVITLSWSKGSGAQKTYVRGEAGSYPTDRADGYEVYFDVGVTDTDIGLTGGTTYYYRVWSFATEGGKEQYSDVYDEDFALALESPTVTTSEAEDVGQLYATFVGNITVLGDGNADEVGFVWDTASKGDPGNAAPGASGYANNNTTVGSFGVGEFTHYQDGLVSGDEYFLRACAHNGIGWDYGAEKSFTTLELVLWFEPNAIIVGTTLVDRAGTNDGAITWGTNPVGLAVTIGSLVSESQPVPSIVGGEEGEVVADIAPAITQPSDYLTGRDMSTNPLYALVKPLADLSGFNESWIWIISATIIVFVVMVIALWKLHSQLIGGIAGFAFIALFYSMGIYPFWILIVYAMIAVAIVVFERVQSV